MDRTDPKAPTSRALILLDFQHDFLANDGRLPVARHHVDPVLAAARLAVDQARDRGDLIIKVGNEFRRQDVLGNLFRRRAAVAGSPGTAWDHRINVDGALYVPKSAGSAFTNPALEAALQACGVRTVAIAGLFAKGCVYATAAAALRRGYAVELLQDAIACSSDRSRAQSLERLSGQGATLT
ncbi:nicotinamidase-related amidase [Pseudarthrobacter defluvii]|uniref:Nicotinamidase-related amidase n=1 Tax=Pseudarthrobacter defluvii TaxID=410837 RepID=A0ABT9UFN6_9MICC|nr:cysteine hydrolase [Pseudarthrobacter defluvii]MDQ0118441.1 nicotinamidase-related amidase [Pseudarthrobacter defluvii]